MSLDSSICNDLCYELCQPICNGSETNEAPTNTTQPTVSGSSVPTEEAETDNGTWESSTEITFTYQWQLDGVDIIGATSRTILLLLAWVGQTLRCVVKATNSFGFTLAVSTAIVVTL